MILSEREQKIKDFMTLHQIEQCITKLNNDNSRSCLDLVNFYLNNLEQKWHGWRTMLQDVGMHA